MNPRAAVAVAALTLGCAYYEPTSEGGETGDYQPEPVQDETAPQWHCQERIRTLFPNLAEEEWCTFTPADAGKSHKPYWGYTTSQVNFDPREGLEDVAHPIYHVTQPDDENPLAGVTHYTAHLHPNASALASGLISNYGFWIGGIPNIRGGIRPPIIHASFFDVWEGIDGVPTVIGHPELSGRYTATGVPCSDSPVSNPNQSFDVLEGLMWPELLNDFWSASASPECAAYVEYYGVSPVLPLYDLYGTIDSTISNSQCLSNNGQDEFVDAVALAAPANNGLVWLNWNSDNVKNFRTWVHGQALGAPDLAEFFSGLLVFLDAWELAGGDPPYWPDDPPWKYNHWTWTGVCGHVPVLGEWDHTIRTAAGCPSTMIAQFDDLSPADLDAMNGGAFITGRCIFPYVIDQAPPGAALPGPVPGWSTGLERSGQDGTSFLDVSVLDERTQAAWLESVEFVFDGKGAPGYRVHAVNELGRDLLRSLRLPEGSKVLDVGRVVVADDEFSEDGELTQSRTSVLELGAEVLRLLNEGMMVPAALDAPDGTRVHRYISPYRGG